MLTAQSQKADYYHPEGLVRPSPRLHCEQLNGRVFVWETTQQINFFLATRDRIREGLTICAIVRREAECLQAPVT
jgi:hypothetical protein